LIPSNKPGAQESAVRTPPPVEPAPSAPQAGRATVTERGVAITVTPNRDHERPGSRNILYERLTGEAARQRATDPEPKGAGLTRDEAEKVESIEVWSTPDPADGHDFRMYSFGGALIASRSTRGH
jgi:hypothetical protein